MYMLTAHSGADSKAGSCDSRVWLCCPRTTISSCLNPPYLEKIRGKTLVVYKQIKKVGISQNWL